MFPAIFEFLGTTEMLVILLVALIIFGPRKLPELGRSLGRSIGEFKRASEDFKRTWEREVEMEKLERELRIEDETQRRPAALVENDAATNSAPAADWGATGAIEGQTIARTSPTAATASRSHSSSSADAQETPYGAGKQDWL